jgi:sugar lactone lactonase YvrE
VKVDGLRIHCEYDVAVEPPAQLGEGPRWDAQTGTLLWVDILGRRLHRYDPARACDDWVHIGELVSAALPRASGHPLLGLPDGFYEVDGRKLSRLVPLEAERPENRTNDAACDPEGRLWAGTMALDERTPSAGLYRIDADLTVTRVLEGTSISNGLGWSPGGDRFYFIDSPTRRIDVFDFHAAVGAIDNRRPLATVPVRDGVPDGLAVDAEGCVWVALHGGWGLNRYSPEGELVAEVRLPVAKVTSCCFGGPELRDLYVTTRRESLSERELQQQPLAGVLFRLDVGVAGLPTHAFAG